MDVYLGTICAFGLNYAPYQWAQCQGQIIPISSNTALFALLGVAYGGNGTSNFGLPNLQGCAAMGQGNNGSSTYMMGETGGARQVTLNTNTMPAHTHAVSFEIEGKQSAANTASPAGGYLGMAEASGVVGSNYNSTTDCNMAAPTVTLAPFAGGSNAIPIESPYLGLTYAIATAGIFPPRS